MPVSFLEAAAQRQQTIADDARLKARQLVREFAAYRFGLFKESGFRGDFMYPTFSALAGAETRPNQLAGAANRTVAGDEPLELRGFDANWAPCNFDASHSSGLPANAQAAQCAPYLARWAGSGAAPNATNAHSFNLMAADPFAIGAQRPQQQEDVLHWLDVADSAKWHFCGENFAPTAVSGGAEQATQQQPQARAQAKAFAHNEKTANKQNKLCSERSALDVIKSSDDFRATSSTFR